LSFCCGSTPVLSRLAPILAIRRWTAIVAFSRLDLRRPADFDLAARTVSPNDIRRAVLVTSSTNEIVETIASFADLSIDVVHLHQFGRSQVEFIKRVGTDVLPAL